MTAKPLRVLPMAQDDIAAALDYYRTEVGVEVAVRLADAVSRRLQAISAGARLGSLRYAEPLRIDGLRCAKVARFPYLLFYLEQPEEIEVWRMLHNRRDIPATLRE